MQDCSSADPTTSNSHIRTPDPGPSSTWGLSLKPVPPGASRQFGVHVRCKTRRKDGKEHRYWSVVETVRVRGGRVVQRHETVAIGTGDRPRPEVGQVYPIRKAPLRKKNVESVLNPLAQFYGQPLELRLQLAGKTSRLFDGGLHYQSSYRIEIVRHATKPNPDRLERNASSAGSRIQNGQTSQIVANCGLQPVRVTAIQRVTEGPVVAIRIGDSDALG